MRPLSSAAAALVLLAGCSDDRPGSGEVTAAVEALATDQAGSDEAMVALVEAVARDGITEQEAVVVVEHLEEHLDVFGDSAASGRPISRPDTVGFFAALADHGQVEPVAQALAAWSVDLVSGSVEAHDPAYVVERALEPALHVTAAAINGEDLTGQPDDALRARIRLIQLELLAEVLAEAHGRELPPPDERSSFVSEVLGPDLTSNFSVDVRRLAAGLDADSSWADSAA